MNYGWDTRSSHHSKGGQGNSVTGLAGGLHLDKVALALHVRLCAVISIMTMPWPPQLSAHFQFAFWCHCDKTTHHWFLPAFSQLSHAVLSTDPLTQFKWQQWCWSVWAVTKKITLFNSDLSSLIPHRRCCNTHTRGKFKPCTLMYVWKSAF